MTRPRIFPSELYVIVEEAGTENEFLSSHLSPDDCANVADDVRVGRYMLHEVLTIGTKIVTKKSSPR